MELISNPEGTKEVFFSKAKWNAPSLFDLPVTTVLLRVSPTRTLLPLISPLSCPASPSLPFGPDENLPSVGPPLLYLCPLGAKTD
jgi:hypothetical protein